MVCEAKSPMNTSMKNSVLIYMEIRWEREREVLNLPYVLDHGINRLLIWGLSNFFFFRFLSIHLHCYSWMSFHGKQPNAVVTKVGLIMIYIKNLLNDVSECQFVQPSNSSQVGKFLWVFSIWILAVSTSLTLMSFSNPFHKMWHLKDRLLY